MTYIIGPVNTSRHTFKSMVGIESKTEHLFEDDMIIFSLQQLWLIQMIRVKNLFMEHQHVWSMAVKAISIRLVLSLK